jgi:hypothetical protein
LHRLNPLSKYIAQDVWSVGLVWGAECSEEKRCTKKCYSRITIAVGDVAEAREAFTKPDGRARPDSPEER